jgi:hypothetical protein
MLKFSILLFGLLVDGLFASHFSILSSEMNSTKSFDDECEFWTKRHVYFANDIHFYNTTIVFVKIDSANDLNISAQCSSREYNIESLTICANTEILIDNDMDLRGIIKQRSSSRANLRLDFNSNDRCNL